MRFLLEGEQVKNILFVNKLDEIGFGKLIEIFFIE